MITTIEQAERDLDEGTMYRARERAKEVARWADAEPESWRHAGYASPLEAARVLLGSAGWDADEHEYAALLVARDHWGYEA